jgi:glycosyltransferase involved in cell wall biosynthesis
MVNPESLPPEGPLRILQIGPTAHRGGVTTSILTLTKALRQEGHDVMLVTNGGDLAELARLGVDCRVTSFSQEPLSIVRGTYETARAVRQFRPDIVHVHGRAPSLRSYLSGRTPDWFTLHSTHLTERVGFVDAGLVRRILSPMGRRFFVLDELARQYLQDTMGIDRQRVEIVFNGVDCVRYRVPSRDERSAARARFGVTEGQTLVVFVGRFHACKQPLGIVELAKAARAAGQAQARFAIVGEGELEGELRAAIAGAGLEDVCKLYGWMDPLQAYFAADVLAMPSLHEGFPLVSVEAMATGCPVLRSRTGGAEQTIVEGETGFCCDTEVSSFVEVALRVLSQPARLGAMRLRAREWAATHFSSAAQARMMVGHYRRHLRRPAAQRRDG